MKKNEKKMAVLARLTMNDGLPMTAKEVETIMGIKPRDLRDIVRDLRMAHVKVCSGDAGYWLWDGKDDSWSRTQARIKSHAKREFELLKAMSENALEGQQEFSLEEREETWRKALMNL